MVALTNKTKTILSYPREIKFNASLYLNIIEEPN